MATVRTDHRDTEYFKLERGVRQGFILSPYLFNLYTEYIIRKTGLEEMEEGIHIDGRIISNLRYADDTTLLSDCKTGLESIILKIKEESKKCGLNLNLNKTRILTTTGDKIFEIEGNRIEVVQNYILLGARIDEDGKCLEEVKRRIAIGKKAMTKLDKVMKDRDISRETKIRLVKALVFPTVTYGCESWTLRKEERKKIEAFEMWVRRKMLRVPWTAKRTNASILEQIKPELSLEAVICRLKLTYFGHVMRKNGLEKQLMLGKIRGERGMGRPRMKWMDGVKEATRKSLEVLRQLIEDQSSWRTFVHNVTKSRPQL